MIGLGRIGSAAALRAKVLGMDVVFYDPYKPDGYDRALGIRRAETLEELLAQSMVVSDPLSLYGRDPRHDQRRGDCPDAGTDLISSIPPAGRLSTRPRFPTALASGRLAGAGIDVLPHEPPAADDPLIVAWRDPNHAAHERLILNPHAAFYSEEGLLDIRTKSTKTCRRAIVGQPLAM